MRVSKRNLLAAPAGLVIILPAIANAQTPSPPSDMKSYAIGALNDGEAYLVGKDMKLQKSNVKITAAQHKTALSKGARAIRPRVVIYRWVDKLYMLDNVGRRSPDYEDQFILDP
jgi:hypothetical protein